MSKLAWVVCLLAVVLSGCRPRTAATMEETRDSEFGFALRHPPGWIRIMESERGVRYVPPADRDRSTRTAEFIVVYTVPAENRLSDEEIRAQVFSLLPVHGVSGFQQDSRTTEDVLWYKFEVTGATDGVEWASVGIVTTGRRRFHVLVCAKPLDRWREGQKQCDEVMRSFQPGTLN